MSLKIGSRLGPYEIFYDVGHQHGTDYLVMGYLEGETLSDARRGPLPRQPDRTGILRSNHRRRQLAGGGRA